MFLPNVLKAHVKSYCKNKLFSIMGGVLTGYLDLPITDVEVQDGLSKMGLAYGAGSMQGWRNANEVCYILLNIVSCMFTV